MRRRGTSRADYIRDTAVIQTRGQWIALIVFLCLLVALPLMLERTRNLNWLTFVNFTIITIIAVLGLNIITGMAGQISLGHSAFVMVGGFVAGSLIVKGGLPLWVALPVAAIVTAAIGLVVAIPAMRLRGFYVAIVTLAFFYIAQYIIRSLDVTGGIHGLIGIPRPQIGGLIIKSHVSWYYLFLILAVLCVAVSINIARSRLGRSFLVVRDNDIAAAGLGVNVPLAKLRAFFLGSLFAGVAGGLWANYVSVIRVDQFTIWDSIWYLGMLVVGGAGSTTGTVAGVIFLRLVGQVLHVIGTSGWIPLSSTLSIYTTYAIYGLAIVLFATFMPYGLTSGWRKLKTHYKRWPFGV